MPADFDKCVKDGGRVRRKSLKGGKYVNICFKDGKSYEGYMHQSTSEGDMKAKSS